MDEDDPNQARLPCRFFQLGQCTKGPKCPFLHQEASHFSQTLCKFFLNGYCRNGDRCPFAHAKRIPGKDGFVTVEEPKSLKGSSEAAVPTQTWAKKGEVDAEKKRKDPNSPISQERKPSRPTSPAAVPKPTLKKSSGSPSTVSPSLTPTTKSPRGEPIFEADEDVFVLRTLANRDAAKDSAAPKPGTNSKEASPMVTPKVPVATPFTSSNPAVVSNSRRVSSPSQANATAAMAIGGASPSIAAAFKPSSLGVSPSLASPVWGSTHSLWAAANSEQATGASLSNSMGADGGIWGSTLGSPSTTTLRDRSFSRGSQNSSTAAPISSTDWPEGEPTRVEFTRSATNVKKALKSSFDGSDPTRPDDGFDFPIGSRPDRRRSEASVAPMPIGSPVIGSPIGSLRSRSISAPKIVDVVTEKVALASLESEPVSAEKNEDFDFNDILTYEVDVSSKPFIIDPTILDAPSTPTKPPRAPTFAANAKEVSRVTQPVPTKTAVKPQFNSDDSDDDFSPVPTHLRSKPNGGKPPSSSYIAITTQPEQQRISSRDPPVLCTFHLEGNCRYGAQCRNIHGEYCSICGKAALIPNDSEQNEDHMFECAEKQRLKEDLDESREFACERCGDLVVDRGKRFGILTDCDHCFCLQCIKEYRNQSQSSDCPVCGKVSYYVVPSNIMVFDKIRKEAIISHYKDKMKQIPCKYYDGGRGSCKFGANCHYAHKGDPIPTKGPLRTARTITDSEGESVAMNSSFNLGMFLTSKKTKKHGGQSAQPPPTKPLGAAKKPNGNAEAKQ